MFSQMLSALTLLVTTPALVLGGDYNTWWQLGEVTEDFPSPCFVAPGEFGGPTTLPCMGLQYFLVNCTYGISLKEAMAKDPSWEIFGPNTHIWNPLTNASQQACYCDGDYWDYVRGCNACMMTQAVAPGLFPDPQYGYCLPSEYFDQQSTAYCSGKPTAQATDFLRNFKPTSTVNSSCSSATSPPLQFTAASQYYNLSATITAPTQTVQIGSLVPTATTLLSGAGSLVTAHTSGSAWWLSIVVCVSAALAC